MQSALAQLINIKNGIQVFIKFFTTSMSDDGLKRQGFALSVRSRKLKKSVLNNPGVAETFVGY